MAANSSEPPTETSLVYTASPLACKHELAECRQWLDVEHVSQHSYTRLPVCKELQLSLIRLQSLTCRSQTLSKLDAQPAHQCTHTCRRTASFWMGSPTGAVLPWGVGTTCVPRATPGAGRPTSPFSATSGRGLPDCRSGCAPDTSPRCCCCCCWGCVRSAGGRVAVGGEVSCWAGCLLQCAGC